MFLLLVICWAFLHLSEAMELINTIKSKRFHDNFERDDLHELSNLITNFDIDEREPGCEYTALRYAASKAFTGPNSKLVCECLLNKGANVNARDSSGSTPLMQAAYEGNEELVRFLLRKGANPYLKNNSGLTALDRANGKETLQRGFFGVAFDLNEKKWSAQRWSEMQQKNLYNGYYNDELIAAHVSDTLVRALIANGEQCLTYAINFPAPGEWIEHDFDPNCASMLEFCENDEWCILNVNPKKFLKKPLHEGPIRALISEFLGNAFVLYKK